MLYLPEMDILLIKPKIKHFSLVSLGMRSTVTVLDVNVWPNSVRRSVCRCQKQKILSLCGLSMVRCGCMAIVLAVAETLLHCSQSSCTLIWSADIPSNEAATASGIQCTSSTRCCCKDGSSLFAA